MSRVDAFNRARARAASLAAIAALPVALLAAPADAQQAPPPPAAPRATQPPSIADTTLANGLRVVVARKTGVPLVSMLLTVHRGAESEYETPGVVQMTAALLPKGTRSRGATAIARAVEALGGEIESGAGWDQAATGVTVTTPNAGAAAAILADVVRNPAFSREEIERQRQQTVDELTVELGDPGSISSLVAQAVVYEGSGYAFPASGTPESVARLTRENVVSTHRRLWRPDNATLVFAGDIAPAAAWAIARSAFGGWKAPAEPLVAPLEKSDAHVPFRGSSDGPITRRVVVVDMPDAGQAAVTMARPAFTRGDPAYLRAQVLNSILGGGYSSRLNQEIRIRRGLSYGAFSGLQARREHGALVAGTQTKNESADEVAGLLTAELGRLGTEPLSEAELVPRKATLMGDFARNLETADGLAASIASLSAQGIGLDWLARFPGEVQRATAAELQALAARRLGADSAHVVVVGDSKQFLEALRRRFRSVEVVPLAELDLLSRTLRKGGAQ